MKKDEAQNLNGESKPLQDYKEAVCKLNEKMVHDLRSPLTIITLQAELMKVEGSLSARACIYRLKSIPLLYKVPIEKYTI